jgi:hypothetical protein
MIGAISESEVTTMFIDISSKEGEEDKLKARLTMLMPHASRICSLHKQVRRDKELAQPTTRKNIKP